MKTCTKCKLNKPLDKFHKDTRNKTINTHSWCKECTKKYHKVYYQANKTHIKERQKIHDKTYRQANKERVAKRKEKYYHSNSERLKNSKLLRKWGLTIDDYNRLLLEQNNKCAIWFG